MPEKPRTYARHETFFVCDALSAHTVFLAGSFNEWSPNATPMDRDRKGRSSAFLELPPGDHEHQYVVDGSWTTDPTLPEPREDYLPCRPNGLAGSNLVVRVR